MHTPPVVGIKAGDLPIGQIVKLMEGGVETEFIVVNQGIPGSMYDSSCGGTWLLRKICPETRVWASSGSSSYPSSDIFTWLNGGYFNTLGSIEQSLIKEIKLPYVSADGLTTYSGADGVLTKVFLLGSKEIGVDQSDSIYASDDGAKLDYFEAGSEDSARLKRVAEYAETSRGYWYGRSAARKKSGFVFAISNIGAPSHTTAESESWVRPALIIPLTSIFDGKTYTLLGGASDPPPPLNIYSIGQSALSNVTDFLAEKSEGEYTEISFNSDGLKLFSKYGSAESTIGFKLSSAFISDYKTLVVKVGYTDTKGTPRKAVIGWGNGNYYYNLRYYDPEQYSNYGTTDYVETSFIGADSISNPTEYRIDISTVTSNTADYTIAMAFTGSGDSATTYGCYALITDIHLE